MIASKDVSIVVQGPVCGTKRRPNLYTKKCLSSARKYFPDAEIIFSTWGGEKTAGLSCDRCVMSEQPELKKCLYEDMTEHFVSTNHLLISSKRGLELATRKYVIKMRSDMLFRNNKCLTYIGKFDAYEKRNLEWKVFQKRLLVLPQLNPRRVDKWYPYSICDWIQIGLRQDVIDLYDVPLVDIDRIPIRDGMRYIYADDYLGAEQYLFHSLLKRHGLPVTLYSRTSGEGDIRKKNAKAIAMNMVLLSAGRMGVASMKYPGRMYAIAPCLSLGYYTFGEWKDLYNNYGGGCLRYTRNPIEQGIYRIAFGIRRRGKDRC